MAKHLHKYKRVVQNPSKRIIYKCMDGCSHYTTAELVIGMPAKCWKCDEKFIVTKALLSQRVNIVCGKCKTGKGKRQEEKVVSILDTRIEDMINKLL